MSVKCCVQETQLELWVMQRHCKQRLGEKSSLNRDPGSDR